MEPELLEPVKGETEAPMTSTDLTVVVPVYNEEEAITATVEKLLDLTFEQRVIVVDKKAADATAKPLIIVVDDGSTDGTRDVLTRLEQTHGERIKVLLHPENRGYGAALKTGIRAAATELVAIIDADGTYDPEELSHLVEAMDTADMVVGSREKGEVKIPLIRRPAKWFLKTLAEYLTGRRIPDLNSGLRVFRKRAAVAFLAILPDGFSFTTTITLASLSYGFQVEFVPISYHSREGRSKIRPIRDTLNFILLILKAITYFNPLRVFLPIAFLLLFSGFSLLWISYFCFEQVMDITVIVLSLSGLQIGLIGLVADLIVHGRRLGDSQEGQ